MRFPILLILLLPILELWLMIEIGGEVGALAVVLWLLAMIVVGSNLLRYLRQWPGANAALPAAGRAKCTQRRCYARTDSGGWTV